MNSVANEIDDMFKRELQSIIDHREKIKNDYVRAWLAVNVDDAHLNADFIINNVVLVEKQHGLSWTWHLELRK